MPDNINQVALTGNLTRDPKIVELPSGHVFSELQLACHRRSRDELTGVWQEWPDYFTVKTFGFQARTTYEHLCKGQGIALSGRLSSRRTTDDNDDGGRPRHEVEIIAEVVQFLSRPHRR